MLPAIEAWVRNLITTVRVNYGVDPLIYLGLCVACAPPFYTALFFLLRAIARKDGRRANTLVGLCIFVYFFPGFYLIFFGHNLPWWIWCVLAVLVGLLIHYNLAHVTLCKGRAISQTVEDFAHATNLEDPAFAVQRAHLSYDLFGILARLACFRIEPSLAEECAENV